jgi:hypothetical protein
VWGSFRVGDYFHLLTHLLSQDFLRLQKAPLASLATCD